jgi:hypothetical protein
MVALQNLHFLSAGDTQTGEVQGVVGDKNLYNRFILDSGASTHLVGRRDIFIQYNDFDGPTSNGIGGSQIRPVGKGIIRIVCNVNRKQQGLTLKDVLYSPHVGVNLLSIGQIWDSCKIFRKVDRGVEFGDQVLFTAVLENRILILDTWQDEKAYPAYEQRSENKV